MFGEIVTKVQWLEINEFLKALDQQHRGLNEQPNLEKSVKQIYSKLSSIETQIKDNKIQITKITNELENISSSIPLASR